MSTEETQVAPAATEIQAEIAQQPEVATPEPEKVEQEEKPQEDEKDKTLRRMERRINAKHAQAAAAEERARMAMQEAEALKQRLSQYETPQQEQPQQVNPYELAKHIATVERINEKSNNIAQDGQRRFGADFGEAVRTVAEEAGALFDQYGRATAVGDAVLDSEDPAALLNYLGKNPDVAAELKGLSPAALGRRIGRIEAQINAKPQPKPVSKAPDPVKPIGATRGTSSPAEMSMEEYVAWRKGQGAAFR